MVAQSQRLSRDEFNRFFSVGKRIHSKFGTLIYSPADETRAAVVVSKKVAASAVERNTLRRRVYATLRECAKKGVYIILLKKGAKEATRQELKNDMTSLIHKGGAHQNT